MHTTIHSRQESLPWCHAASGRVITADARIDNRAELLNALDLPASEQVGDGELILRAYLAWGEDCVQRLAGDFAFAVWDPARQRLFCARDRLGMRPFYFGQFDERLLFASSALAITRAVSPRPALNEARVADFLVGEIEGIDKEVTFFNGIHRLPPASSLVCAERTARIIRESHAFKLADPLAAKPSAIRNLFRVEFEQAVSRCLVSDRPVASMLSGGVDSSTIVGVAATLQKQGNTPGESSLATTVSQVSDNPQRSPR
jgi:asparagine synthase (glutamine-hydrolysing)